MKGPGGVYPLASELGIAARKAREWTERRDELIRQARDEGLSLRGVANLVGLSHTAVANIVARAT